MATWTRTAPDLPDRFDRGARGALLAMAYVYFNELKRRLAGGYTSGNFVTGQLLNSIAVAGPEPEGDGLVVRVGTMLLYALAWELGHNNLFTRRFERQERWFPTALDTEAAQQQAARAVFGQALETGSDLEFAAGGAPTGPNFPPSPYPSNPLGPTRRRGAA